MTDMKNVLLKALQEECRARSKKCAELGEKLRGEGMKVNTLNVKWVDKCIGWAERYIGWTKFPDEISPLKKGLLLHGGHDTGKTFVAGLIAKNIKARTIYMSDFGVNYRADAEWLANVMDAAKDGPVMIDDLGAEGPSVDYGSHEAVDNMLLSMVENFKRYKHPIIVTMNPRPSLSELGEYAGPRVAYRMMNYFLHLDTGDVPYSEDAE